ncbi:outer membrane protein [Helicobacter felis]|uniref:OMP593 n=1 Tax=Helicobacter felis TaxID=214 RepID=A0A1M4NHJ2_HELFE|nr:outer membrane protein [Helicobacter felis]SFZ71019.1 OMP593 [Helicobacter felis ATCC 49179]
MPQSNNQTRCCRVIPSTSHLSQAFLTSALTLFTLAPLSAEDSGPFIQGGFQYSNFSGMATTVVKPVSAQELIQAIEPSLYQKLKKEQQGGQGPPQTEEEVHDLIQKIVQHDYPNGIPSSKRETASNGNLYGVDIQFGYKQFFGQEKHFGLRYYGLFSGQGGNSYNKAGKYYQPSANLFYGVGADVLYNFYENNDRTYGIFAGVMFGGSSWLMGEGKTNGKCSYKNDKEDCISMNDSFENREKQVNQGDISKASFSPTYVQFVFNFGFRINFTKHQGFEFGTRIPTINDPYYKATQKRATETGGKGSETTITFRRNASLYWNYVYNF